jgi:hypothetical protein
MDETVVGNARVFIFQTTVPATASVVISKRPFVQKGSQYHSDAIVHRTAETPGAPKSFHKLTVPLSVLEEGRQYYCIFRASAPPRRPLQFEHTFTASFPKVY